MSAIYIGCGTDIVPIQQFDATIRHFVYVDSLPYCEWEDSYKEYTIDNEHKRMPFRDTFIPAFLEKMERIKYSLVAPLPSLEDVPKTIYLKFEKRNIHDELVTVECYFSTPFPWRFGQWRRTSIQLELYGKIARATYLIAVGHLPHLDVLKLLGEYTLIANTNTCYTNDDEETFLAQLYKRPELQQKIRNVLLYHPRKLVVTTLPQIEEKIKQLVQTYGPDERYL